jgi:16S rRNA processing protein RimM
MQVGMTAELRKPQHAPDFVVIGDVQKPHGIRGELRVRPLTEEVERFKSLTSVYLNRNGERQLCTVLNVKIVPDGVLMRLEEIPTRNEAELWRQATVEIAGDQVLPLPEGQHYYFEMDGLTVVTESGQTIGQIVDIHSYPAHDVYVVRSESRDIMIPAIAEFVVRVDLEQKLMVVRIIDGLLDL